MRAEFSISVAISNAWMLLAVKQRGDFYIQRQRPLALRTGFLVHGRGHPSLAGFVPFKVSSR